MIPTLLTLSQAKTRLLHLIESRDEEEFERRLSEALERLWGMGDWMGMLEIRRLTSYKEALTSNWYLNVNPRESILGLADAETGVPNQFWPGRGQFHQHGEGWSDSNSGTFLDLGLRYGVESLGPYTLTISTNAADDTWDWSMATVDQSDWTVGDTFGAQDIGSTFPDDATFTVDDVSSVANTISGTVVSSTTALTTGDHEVQVASFTTTNPFADVYHVYKVPVTDTYWALIKREPPNYYSTPTDEDEVPITNIGALKCALQATIYEEENDLERANDYWENAREILDKELEAHHQGNKNTVPVSPDGPDHLPTPNMY